MLATECNERMVRNERMKRMKNKERKKVKESKEKRKMMTLKRGKNGTFIHIQSGGRKSGTPQCNDFLTDMLNSVCKAVGQPSTWTSTTRARYACGAECLLVREKRLFVG